MIDPRPAMRVTYAQWLRVRANVRALEHSLAAAEYRLQRDVRECADEPESAMLVAQLRAERSAIDTLGRELDARIATLKFDCSAIETSYLNELVSTARTK